MSQLIYPQWYYNMKRKADSNLISPYAQSKGYLPKEKPFNWLRYLVFIAAVSSIIKACS